MLPIASKDFTLSSYTNQLNNDYINDIDSSLNNDFFKLPNELSREMSEKSATKFVDNFMIYQ